MMNPNVRNPFHHLSNNISSAFFLYIFFSFFTTAFCQNEVDFLCSSPNFVASDGAGEGQGQNTGNGGHTSIYKDLKRKWKKVKIFEVAKNGTVNLCHNVNVRKTIRVNGHALWVVMKHHYRMACSVGFEHCVIDNV